MSFKLPCDSKLFGACNGIFVDAIYDLKYQIAS